MSEVPQNAVLRSLGVEAYRRLSPHLASVELKLGTHLYRDGMPVEWVYFPETSLLSIVATSLDGQTVETSMVGNEGGAGLIEASSSQVSGANCVVQVDGRAQKAPASVWRRLSVTDAEFTLMTFKLAELQLAESRQSGFCQAIHPVGPRLARWVAESTDRCGGRNPLPMTQQFLAAVLGVQRTTVSSFASDLQREGAIRYCRGKLEITDRPRLEAIACECRKLTMSQRDRLRLEPIASPAPARGEQTPGALTR